MTVPDSTASPREAGSDSEESIRRRYLEVDTSNVADVLDELGLPDQGFDSTFVPFPADGGGLAGRAFTIRGQMIPYEIGGGDADKMQACAALPPGSVSVWSGGGEGVCFFGELIAIGMRERGCVGALVDGGIRDVAWLKAAGLPVFARYRTPIQSIGRWKVTGWDVPVTLPGATVKRVAVTPGDYILADDDGALVIPAAVTLEVLERAERMVAREREIRARLSEGMTLSQALEQFGHV